MQKNNFKPKIIRAVLLLGIIVSLLSYLERQWPPLASLCAVFGSGCQQAADFTLFHLPVAIWGIAFYLVVILIYQLARTWAFRFVMAGIGVEATLVVLMLDRNIFCFFCLLNAVVMVLLLLLFIRRGQIWQSIAICLIGYLAASYLLIAENPPPAIAGRHITGDDVVARVNGEKITLADLESGIAGQLFKARLEINKMKREQLFQLIEATLAKQQGQTPSATETAPSSATAQPDGSLVEMSKKIFFETLQNQPDIDAYLEKPPLPYTSISIGDSPSMGPEDAPVTIVEFSDYLCPACRWAHPISKEIRKRYKGKIRWVFKDYPLNRHPGADKLAEAARCAGEQGHFWDYQDFLYEAKNHPEQNDLLQFARSLDLDTQQFSRCIETGQYAPAVMKDKQDGRQAGVSSTPSFMINGRLNPGSMSLENFSQRVDDALRRSNP